MRLSWVSIALFLGAMLAPFARASSLSFDFEDGTSQGWNLSGVGIRPGGFVEGEYSAYGRDGGSMRLIVNLTPYEYVTVRRRFEGQVPPLPPQYADLVPSPEVRRDNFVLLYLFGQDPRFQSSFLIAGKGTAISDDPDVRRFDLQGARGAYIVEFHWNQWCLEGGCPNEEINAGYIDEITFHVPESGAKSAVALLIGVLQMRRRRSRRPDATRAGCLPHPPLPTRSSGSSADSAA